MKLVYVIVSFLVTMGTLSALEQTEFTGKWRLTMNGVEGDLAYKTAEVYHLHKEGSYVSDGVLSLSLVEEGSQVVALSGPESGDWKISSDELVTTVTKQSLDLFMSNAENITREMIDKELESTTGESSTFKLESSVGNKHTFKNEDGHVVVFERIKEASFEAKSRFRRTSQFLAREAGFKFAPGLPLSERVKLRPQEEVISQAAVMYAAMVWVTMSDEQVSSEHLKSLVAHYGGAEVASSKVKEILALDRELAQKKHMDDIGWIMENLWAVSWCLGFEVCPNIDDAMVDEQVLVPMMQHLKSLWQGKDKCQLTLRPLPEVQQLEDLFYCTHNAVRSAQTGVKGCVPEGFHPVMHGGIIHEKRHALTWVLSPEVTWEETDLST